MDRKLLNKVMKKLASSNVVKKTSEESTSSSLSTHKDSETEQIQQKMEQYLLNRYHFRFNVLTEQTEYSKKGNGKPIYKVISQRTLNSLCLEARARHINCWDKDVSRFVNSEQMPDYHPLLSYMDALPEWDGKDRVTPLAQRISAKSFWVNSFHRWLLGVTAQWSGRMARCANAVAPMLVSSEQGRCKSTFCELLMPDSLKDYYTDSFELTGQTGCEQKLAFFGLINLDEYDRLPPQKLPLLKNLMQMKKLDFRKSHRSSYSHLPRMASFIGTSNRKALLTDPSGSRRYFFAEVKEKIDCSPLEHKQLFAQLKAELDEGKRYWFSAEEEAELKLRNQAYYALPTETEMVFHYFRLPEKDEDFKLYSAVALFNFLLKRYPAAMRGMTVNKMGRIMNSIGAERMHTTTGNMYKLVPLAG
ncbi:DUF3874 domain-containing protein [Phocaeicola sartorii]|uniref:DUF3874 domain-containing protein n=1 Tax=Phocaeicola sartorii TaxID=671267 RepID=UPI002583D578|nr:VapE domain-containing protein [Phocaeicola sartorii]